MIRQRLIKQNSTRELPQEKSRFQSDRSRYAWLWLHSSRQDGITHPLRSFWLYTRMWSTWIFLSNNQGCVWQSLRICLRAADLQLQSQSCKIYVSFTRRIREGEMAAWEGAGDTLDDVSRLGRGWVHLQPVFFQRGTHRNFSRDNLVPSLSVLGGSI